MRDAERVPKHDICIVDGLMAMLVEPEWQACERITACLWNMPASGVELIIVVCNKTSTTIARRDGSMEE